DLQLPIHRDGSRHLAVNLHGPGDDVAVDPAVGRDREGVLTNRDIAFHPACDRHVLGTGQTALDDEGRADPGRNTSLFPHLAPSPLVSTWHRRHRSGVHLSPNICVPVATRRYAARSEPVSRGP